MSIKSLNVMRFGFDVKNQNICKF